MTKTSQTDRQTGRQTDRQTDKISVSRKIAKAPEFKFVGKYFWKKNSEKPTKKVWGSFHSTHQRQPLVL